MAVQTDSLTYSVDMRGEGPQRLALVQLDSVRAVQVRDVIVRVHGYQDVCHIGLERIKKKPNQSHSGESDHYGTDM